MGSVKKERQSGIELYKIIAMIIIVSIHTIQSIGQASTDFTMYNGQVINLAHVTDNAQFFIMALIWNFGFYGVNVFFVSSAWFLRDSRGFKLRNPVKLVIDVWVLSIGFLIVYALMGAPLNAEMIIKSFLPTLFSNNWFVTCYLVMYIFHPVLNLVCDNISRKVHLFIAIGGFIYCIITSISEYLLFYSRLIIVMIIYFIVAYAKRYMVEKSDDVRLNRKVFLTAFVLDVFIICIINLLGHRIGLLSDQLMHMQVLENPMFIVMALSGFNIFRKTDIKSSGINYISSLTLYIYVIHENLLFRTYTRPAIWKWFIDRLGYDHILVSLLIYVTGLFLASLLVSAVYAGTLQKLSDRIALMVSDKMEVWSEGLFERSKR